MKFSHLLLGAAVALGCSSSSDSVESRVGALSAAPCSESGHACTWLGLPGEEGFNGDGLRREDTKIYWSMNMAFGEDGIVWFIDWNNHMVRRVLPDQTVETVLGSMEIPGFPGDGGPGGQRRGRAVAGKNRSGERATDGVRHPDARYPPRP